VFRSTLLIGAQADHPDAWLTNRLISDFVPSDFVARYVFSKQTFYTDYGGWGNEAWRATVVDVLKSTYLKDKRLRERLYACRLSEQGGNC